jgi:hypothetical protein
VILPRELITKNNIHIITNRTNPAFNDNPNGTKLCKMLTLVNAAVRTLQTMLTTAPAEIQVEKIEDASFANIG